MERLQRFLARSGVASRRSAERMIVLGAVSVNGRTVTTLGSKIDPLNDRVTVRGRTVVPPAEQMCLMLNKPAGYITTMRDPQGRPKVADLLPPGLPRLFPVGRLDQETTGLLLMTNDGELAQKLLHPSHGVWKTYLACVKGDVGNDILERLRHGVRLDDGFTAPAGAEIVARKDGYAILEIRLHEGRKRQIRRMLAAVDRPVVGLKRIEFGTLKLGDLPDGSWRILTGQEIDVLRATACMSGIDKSRLEEKQRPHRSFHRR